jgi:hypothetical protein
VRALSINGEAEASAISMRRADAHVEGSYRGGRSRPGDPRARGWPTKALRRSLRSASDQAR